MLTAKTNTGKKINLGIDYAKESLLELRKMEEFLCPVCEEEVILKLGEQRIFHFAHKRVSDCSAHFERESNYHMKGKKQLYQWLIRQKIPSQLEYYDPEIRQRPDICFMHNGLKYALEYQCSPIPEKDFFKRTDSYLRNGYIPIWILGAEHIQQKKRGILSLSDFHYLFARNTSEGSYFIPTYCPEKQAFIIVGSIFSYSVKNAFVQSFFFPQSKLTLETLLNPQDVTHINIQQWNSVMEKFHLNWSLHKTHQQQSFLHELYRSNLNPFLLPPEIGLPVKHSLLLKTSPIIWQTYFYLDLLAGKKPGDLLQFSTIKWSFQRRIEKKQILPRPMAPFSDSNPLLAEGDYLQLLEKLGLLFRSGDSSYRIKQSILIPKTNREKEESSREFFQKNKFILSSP